MWFLSLVSHTYVNVEVLSLVSHTYVDVEVLSCVSHTLCKLVGFIISNCMSYECIYARFRNYYPINVDIL